MSNHSGGSNQIIENWDNLFEILSAQPRRMILISLLEEPKERRLPLPEAAVHSDEPPDPESLSIILQHTHLPKLEEAGYVRWERDPFCVQRGPHFEEVATILRWVLRSPEEFSPRLGSDCTALKQLIEDG